MIKASLSPRFEIQLLQRKGKDGGLTMRRADKSLFFKMSATLQWHSMFAEEGDPLQDVVGISLAVTALVTPAPASTLSSTKALSSAKASSTVRPSSTAGARSRSLLHLSPFDRRRVSSLPVVMKDDVICIRQLGIFSIGFWTNSGAGPETAAFIAVNLHYDGLLEDMLRGSAFCVPPPRKCVALFDDIDRTYGLHHYTVTIEIRTLGKTLFGNMYDSLHCERDFEMSQGSSSCPSDCDVRATIMC